MNSSSKGSQHGYHNLKSITETNPSEWIETSVKLTTERLDIDGHPVMQIWETPFMNKLAEVAASRGGRVLEVGFGLGISANSIQQQPLNEHIILEANTEVFKTLQTFKNSAPHKVSAIGPNLWQNSLPTIENNSIDGILYDTYPLVKEEQHTHQFDFIKAAYPKLKSGGILTYCNLTSLGVLRPQYQSWEELFKETQLPYLLKCGFQSQDISFETFPVTPDKKCEYYMIDTALVPICTKA